MGTFTAALEVGNLTGVEFASVEALVDTGAYYTMVDSDLLESLGIQPTEQVELHLADGRVVECNMGEARVGKSSASHCCRVRPPGGWFLDWGHDFATVPVGGRLSK